MCMVLSLTDHARWSHLWPSLICPRVRCPRGQHIYLWIHSQTSQQWTGDGFKQGTEVSRQPWAFLSPCSGRVVGWILPKDAHMHSNYFLTEVSWSRREYHTAQECPRKQKPQDLQGPFSRLLTQHLLLGRGDCLCWSCLQVKLRRISRDWFVSHPQAGVDLPVM